MAAADRLLRTLGRLPYPARQRTLADEARRLAGTPELRPVLDDLAGRDRYELGLGIDLARIAGEDGFLLALLVDPAQVVTPALLRSAVARELPASAFVDRIPSLPRRLRFTLYRLIRRNGPVELADAVFDVTLERFGEGEAARLLCRCSSEVGARRLPQLAFAVSSWSAVGRTHPELVLAYLEGERENLSRPEWSRLVRRTASGIAAATEHDPARVLALLEELEDGVDPFAFLRPHLRLLVRHDAQRVVRLMLDPGRRGELPQGRHLIRDLAVLDDETLVRLARTVGRDGLISVLHALPPSRRPVVYDGVVGGRDLLGTGYPLQLLDELPHPARHAEVARLLELRSVQDHRDLRLAITARGPWNTAEPALRADTRHPDAEERASAYELLLGAAARTRDAATVEQALASSARLLNDRDPVRERALWAVNAMPAHLVDEASAQHLQVLSKAALEARDCSSATRQQIGTLGRRLAVEGSLSQRPAILRAGLALIDEVSDQGWVSSGGYGATLPGGVAQGLFAALRPRLVDDARRGRFDGVLALATDLGRRAWDLPELQGLLAQACRAKSDTVVRRAVSLWLDPPSTRDDRVAEVFRRDRSTITIAEVASTISRRRTDLLDDVLNGPLHGRFLARRVRHVPALSCPQRWLPRQVAAYRELQLMLVRASIAAGWERAGAVHALADLPGSDAVLLAFLDDPDRGLVQDAMTALGHADDPDAALVVLLQRADGDNAHVAVAAAARCAGFVPPDRLGSALSPVLTSPKVTARKEAARLLAVHRVPGALASLQTLWDEPGQHRDVRRAITSVLPGFLDDARAWDLLDRAVADTDLATSVLDTDPRGLPPRHRTPYAARVRAVAAGDDPDNAASGLERLADWALFDPEPCLALLEEVTCDLSSTATWRVALSALIRTGTRLEDATGVRRAAQRLLAAHADVDTLYNAGPERDLPARQRIEALATQFGGAVTPALGAGAADLADAISRSADCLDIAVHLRVATVPWADVGERLLRLREAAATIEGPSLGAHASQLIRTSLASQLRYLEADSLVPLVDDVLDSGEGSAFVAVGLVRAAGPATGWTEPWRAHLRRLRADPDPDVRRLAAATPTSTE